MNESTTYLHSQQKELKQNQEIYNQTNPQNPMEEPRYDSILTEQNNAKVTLTSKQSKFDGLNTLKIWGYGVGHTFNDLVAACWFNYLFLFLNTVVKTPAASSALLAGQIADGLATPVVGLFSDKFNTKIGQRIPWYLFGLVMVTACFIPIFQVYKNNDNITLQYLYYTMFPALFNLGWASMQISHMSLVPSLTCSRKRRDRLNNLRNSFTFFSNSIVLGLGLIIFATMDEPSLQYSIISYCVVTLGFSASIFFLWNVRQKTLVTICQKKSQEIKQMLQQKSNQKMNKSVTQFSEDQSGIKPSRQNKSQVQSIWDWFKVPKFYIFGICYMGVRLYTNLYGTLMPFFIIRVLKLGITSQQRDDQIPYSIALVPLITYLASVLVSSRLNLFYKKVGRKKALTIGTILCLISLGSMFLLDPSNGWVVYILAFFIGCSQSLVLSTGINLISDVVGNKAKTGAFVFGIYSLLDKFSTGIAIFLIGNSVPYATGASLMSDDDRLFIRLTTILIPAAACVLASGIVLSYPIPQYKKSKMKSSIGELEDQFVN